MYTIGHSTRSIEEFIALLKENDVKTLIDVRSFPGSRMYPHFNKENLEKSLIEAGIKYKHIKALGGRRKPQKDSHNTVWKNPGFRGYADYMETEEFRKGINELLDETDEVHSCIMCSEAVWWSCHRSMIADYLKSTGIKVIHILGHENLQEHPYTSVAMIKSGKLSYSNSLFD